MAKKPLTKLYEMNSSETQSMTMTMTMTKLGVSPGSKLCTTFLNLANNDEIMSNNQFTVTATQPQR